MIGLLRRAIASTALWGMASSGLKACMGMFVLSLAVVHLEPDQLGIWYLFTGVGALLTRCDFGFGPTVMRRSATMHAGDGGTAGLRSLRSATRKLYLILGAMGAAILFVATWYLASHAGGTGWAVAWMLYALGILLNLVFGGEQSFACGIGRMRVINQYVLASAIAGGAVMIGGLLTGHGLVALGAGTLVQGLVMAAGALHLGRLPAVDGAGDAPGRSLSSWVGDWWPVSWRTGMTGIGAYLIFFSGLFLSATFLGLEEAGRYGLTVSICTMALNICAIPVTSAVPRFAALFHAGRRAEAWAEFHRRHRPAMLLFALICVAVLTCAGPALDAIGAKGRLLDHGQVLVLAAIFALELNHTLYATLVASADMAPFSVHAMVSGCCAVVIGWIGVQWFGSWGLILGIGLVQASCNNWYPIHYARRHLGIAHG